MGWPRPNEGPLERQRLQSVRRQLLRLQGAARTGDAISLSQPLRLRQYRNTSHVGPISASTPRTNQARLKFDSSEPASNASHRTDDPKRFLQQDCLE